MYMQLIEYHLLL
ncbi:Protein of unknown function [Bacillus cereus]|nr:Protein of unknown function [Bacillus cereus]SCV18803.1 Protein of unknown function [Bacillus cereus]